jgi:Uncharacterized protein conserved in bacteria
MAQRKSTASKGSMPENLSPETESQDVLSLPQVPVSHKKTAGAKLKALRLEKGITLDKVSEVLRISKRYLIAIESVDSAALPEQVYSLGFVRAYAGYLGQDFQPFVNQFKQEAYEGERINQHLEMPEPVRHSELPSKKVLFLSLGTLAAIGIGLKLYGPYHSSFNSVELAATEPSESNRIEESLIKSVSPVVDEVPVVAHQNLGEAKIIKGPESVLMPEAAQLKAEDPTVTFSFQDRTWLELKDKDHKIIISKNFEPEETYRIKPEVGMTFETGNAGGFKIIQQGHVYKVGMPGQVVKGKPLDPEALIKADE